MAWEKPKTGGLPIREYEFKFRRVRLPHACLFLWILKWGGMLMCYLKIAVSAVYVNSLYVFLCRFHTVNNLLSDMINKVIYFGGVATCG